MWLPACVESLILTNLSSTVNAWFLAFKCPEWESQLCHKENNWIGNVFSPGSRACGICRGGRGLPFSPCILQCYSGFTKALPTKPWTWFLTSSLRQMWPHRMWNPGARVSPSGCSPGAEAALYTWGRWWGENSPCCCSHAVPTIYFQPQAASREGLVAALQLPFVTLIPSPAGLGANLCCKPSLHISAKLARKGTFTWQ